MPAKKIPYVHEITGEVVITTRQGAKKLDKKWKPVEFTKNDKGEPVMRLQLKHAVVDISQTESDVELEDGITSTE